MTKLTSAEQQARDMLERMGVKGAQNFSAGEVVDLANLIANAEEWRSCLEAMHNEFAEGFPAGESCLVDEVREALKLSGGERSRR